MHWHGEDDCQLSYRLEKPLSLMFSVARSAKHASRAIGEKPLSVYGCCAVGCVWREMASRVYDALSFLESDLVNGLIVRENCQASESRFQRFSRRGGELTGTAPPHGVP